MKRGEFIYIPRLLIGITSFYADWQEVRLKERNTNRIRQIHYSPGDGPVDNFLPAAAFTLAYSFNKYFSMNADIMYSYFKIDITFTRTNKDIFTQVEKISTISYFEKVHTFSIGLGLIIALK
jgi:hypothetical protein